MARATILSSLGAGLYRVTLHFDNSRIATRLTYMATKIADYTAELAALAPDKTEKTTALNAALTALNDYINATDPAVYVADPTELNALNKATWAARGELDVILHDEKLLKLKKAALEQETANLNKLCPADFETNAWCVEYVTNKSGESEAIICDYALWRDVSNNQIEHDAGVWLPAATTPATNALIHPLASSEHATWFNLCMAPAAQRHAGRYRIATLSNLSGNTCDVAFDGRFDVVRANGNVIDAAPIYPQFASGQQDHYSGANIIYGTCNGAAFANGDRVIVDLHSGVGAPTVIGFYSNPRQCAASAAIPWINIELEYHIIQLINVYQEDYLLTLGTHAPGVDYNHGVVHGIDSLGADIYFEFKLLKQQYYAALLNGGLEMAYGDIYDFSLLYFSAGIPAVISVDSPMAEFPDIPLNNFRIVGSQIIDVATSAVVAVSYTIESYPTPDHNIAAKPVMAIESAGFTMNYSGPATSTPVYPSGSGSKPYVYKGAYTTGSTRYFIQFGPSA